MEKTKTRNSGSRKKVVLVGTYRRDNEAWIADSRQYNLPLPSCDKTVHVNQYALELRSVVL